MFKSDHVLKSFNLKKKKKMFYIYLVLHFFRVVFLFQWTTLDIANSQMRSLVLKCRAVSELVWNCCIGPLAHSLPWAECTLRMQHNMTAIAGNFHVTWMCLNGPQKRTSRDDDSLQLRVTWQSRLEGMSAGWRERKSS